MVDANSGAYVTFDESVSDPAKAVQSSSSIPFVFPSQGWDINGTHYTGMDGGSVWNTNLVSVV